MPRVSFEGRDGSTYSCSVPAAVQAAVEYFIQGSCGDYFDVYMNGDYIGAINNLEDFEREFRVRIR